MKKLTYFAVLAAVFVCLAHGRCPAVCQCPAARPLCPAGVSLVLDGCGCCKVCAAQLNQDCDSRKPCDHHRGLECNYGNDVAFGTGVCRASRDGRSCEYSGRMYQHGEGFRVGCKHHCTCVDGAVGCTPLCPLGLPLASADCPYPRLVREPDQCCFGVRCHAGAVGPPESRWRRKKKKQRAKGRVEKGETPQGNGLWDLTQGWRVAQKQPLDWSHVQKQCVVQTTDWSPCSSTCGMGLSSRITNHNAQCKLESETRLCNIRPCTTPLSLPPKKGMCSQTQKSLVPVHFSYAGCRSVRAYQPNYCGVCVDGRCCVPRHTRTIPVPFQCPGAGRTHKDVMLIQSCKCGHDCGHPNEAAMLPQKWLHRDTHKFID